MGKDSYPAKISTDLSEFDLENIIIECSAVRRPLYIPSMLEIYGEVLSHSAALCTTERGSFLIEFMSDNIVYIKKVDGYISQKNFDFDGHHFIHDSIEIQKPQVIVTIKRFAISMANFMAGKKFDTFVHNCHHARYYTMKKYGMSSKNPKKIKRNILFQGIADFFFRSKEKNSISNDGENKEKNSIDLELTKNAQFD